MERDAPPRAARPAELEGDVVVGAVNAGETVSMGTTSFKALVASIFCRGAGKGAKSMETDTVFSAISLATGRTTESGSVYWGPNPCSAAKTGTITTVPS